MKKNALIFLLLSACLCQNVWSGGFDHLSKKELEDNIAYTMRQLLNAKMQEHESQVFLDSLNPDDDSESLIEGALCGNKMCQEDTLRVKKRLTSLKNELSKRNDLEKQSATHEEEHLNPMYQQKQPETQDTFPQMASIGSCSSSHTTTNDTVSEDDYKIYPPYTSYDPPSFLNESWYVGSSYNYY